MESSAHGVGEYAEEYTLDGIAGNLQYVAWTADFAVRVFSVAMPSAILSDGTVSKLRRLCLSDRYFFITMRLLPRRTNLAEADFELLALAFNRTRASHRFYLTVRAFLPDHWHCIVMPLYPDTISRVLKSVNQSSMSGINARRETEEESWQPRFFDHAIRTVKDYHAKVEYIHLNPVRAGLVSQPENWKWSSFHEYAGVTPDQQRHRCSLTIDRVTIPADGRTQL